MKDQNGISLKRYHIVFAVACFLMLTGTIAVLIQDHNREFRQYQEAYRQAELQRPKAGGDGIAPRRGIQQVVLKNLPVDMPFEKTPRVDRCLTCHQAIDNPDPRYSAPPPTPSRGGEGEGGGPPRLHPVLHSHPRLDLYVAPNSKHPYSTFGCTICHLGRPMGTGFSRAAHSPQHTQQAAEWELKCGWSPLESWEQKMLPLQHTEASCLKCHRGLDEIPEADRLNKGRELFRNRGCTNCHMSGADSGDTIPISRTAGNRVMSPESWVGRTGPDLRRIGEKLSLQWCIGWTLNPCDFRPSTAMPRFLGLENRKEDNGEPLKLQLSAGSQATPASQARPAAVDRDAVETEALCTYLFVTSKLRERALPEPPAGDAEEGRKLFSAAGCCACHSTRDLAGADQFALSTFAPDLSRIGDKVSPRWLFAWLKEPHQHWAETKMPNLRLSDTEAAAIAAYLTQTMRSGVQPVFYHAFPEEAFDALIIDKFSPMIPRERLAALLKDTAGLFEFTVGRSSGSPGDPEGRPTATKERLGLSALAAKVNHAAGPDGKLKDLGTGEWTEKQIAKIKEILSAEKDKARAVKAFFAGEFLIQQHGCYACHNIQGWTYAPLPCPNLQGEADKELARFAFGRTLADGSVANTKWDWIRTKIARPRVYDLGSLNQTRPFDRLRMPLFNLTPAQIDCLVTHVLSLTLEPLPLQMQHKATSRELVMDRGHRVFRELNCTACHLAGLARGPCTGQTEVPAQVPLESLVALLAPGTPKPTGSGIYASEDLVSLNYAARQASGAQSGAAPLLDMLNIKRGTCLTNTTVPILLAEMPVCAGPLEPATPAGFRLVEGPPKPAGGNWIPFGELVSFERFQRLTVPLFYFDAAGAARAYAQIKDWWADQDGYERVAGTAALAEAGKLTLGQMEERKQARQFFEPARIKVRFTKGEGAIVPHIVKLESGRGVPNVGPQQAPPSLVFEGSRVQPDWLYQYLRNVHTLRWGFTVRMPSFWDAQGAKAVYPSGRLSALKDGSQRGAGLDVEPLPVPDGLSAHGLPDDVAQVVEFLACDAGEKPFGCQPLPLDGAEDIKLYEQGRQIVTGSEPGCTNCHAFGARNPPEPKWALNLANVKRRLKEPWLNRFLINPQSVYPWTNMPNNFKIDWEGSYSFNPFDPLRGLMDGDAAKAREGAERIRAVKCYLLHLGEGEIGK